MFRKKKAAAWFSKRKCPLWLGRYEEATRCYDKALEIKQVQSGKKQVELRLNDRDKVKEYEQDRKGEN